MKIETLDQAKRYLWRVVGVAAHAKVSRIHTNSSVVEDARGQLLEMPVRSSWYFFIDEEPDANWAHDCKYVSISGDGIYCVIPHNMPLADDYELDEVKRPVTPPSFVAAYTHNNSATNSGGAIVRVSAQTDFAVATAELKAFANDVAKAMYAFQETNWETVALHDKSLANRKLALEAKTGLGELITIEESKLLTLD